MTHPRALIFAGPNGAGKTTLAKAFLPREGGCRAFFNADMIAAGLSPFAPDKAAIQAARLMLHAIGTAVASGSDFAVETTFAGRGYRNLIESWKQAGYRVSVLFLYLPCADLAIERVRIRVRQGGHDIPEDTIRRRFAQGRDNFAQLYRPMADGWQVHDASRLPIIPAAAGEADSFPGLGAAIPRAAEQVRRIAVQTGTPLAIWQDGSVVQVPASSAQSTLSGTSEQPKQ